MPESASKVLDLLGVEAGKAEAGAHNIEAGDPRSFAALDERLAGGTELPKPEPVFPKYVEPED